MDDDSPTDHSTPSTTNSQPSLSSLDILSPPTTTACSAPAKTPAALFLEDLHVHIVHILNIRQYDHPDLETYLHKDLTAYMEHVDEPYVTSREAFLDRYRAIIKESPGYRFEAVDVNASVDETKNAALVWFRLRIWGHPEGVEREGVYVSMWKKSKGVWVCHRQNGIRGMKV